MPEVICTLGFREGIESFADLLLQSIDGELGGSGHYKRSRLVTRAMRQFANASSGWRYA